MPAFGWAPVITETKLANSDLPEQLPSLPGYEFEFVPSPLPAGGVGMFISGKLRYKIHSFFYKNVVSPAQAEYSYFSADFRLKIFLCYS